MLGNKDTHDPNRFGRENFNRCNTLTMVERDEMEMFFIQSPENFIAPRNAFKLARLPNDKRADHKPM